jgi:cytochrome P450
MHQVHPALPAGRFSGLRGCGLQPLRDLKSADPHPLLRELRDRAPVHWSPEVELFSVSRHEEVLALLKDASTFSSEAMLTVLMSGMMVPITPRYALKTAAYSRGGAGGHTTRPSLPTSVRHQHPSQLL